MVFSIFMFLGPPIGLALIVIPVGIMMLVFPNGAGSADPRTVVFLFIMSYVVGGLQAAFTGFWAWIAYEMSGEKALRFRHAVIPALLCVAVVAVLTRSDPNIHGLFLVCAIHVIPAWMCCLIARSWIRADLAKASIADEPSIPSEAKAISEEGSP